MEISKMLTISTAHISEETSKLLDDETKIWPMAVYDKAGCGWYIYISSDSDILKELPADLALIMMFANLNGIDVVCLDSDGDEIEGLPTYDW